MSASHPDHPADDCLTAGADSALDPALAGEVPARSRTEARPGPTGGELPAALEALAESEEKYRTIFDFAPIGISSVNAAGRFLRVNLAFQRLCGYAQEELLAMTFEDLTDPADLEANRSLFREMVVGQRPGYRLEKRYRAKGGQRYWGRVVVAAVRDADGRFLHSIAMTEDVTERKCMEEALRQREAELRRTVALLENVPDAVITVDPEFRILTWSAGAERIYGWRADEILGRSAADVLRTVFVDQTREAAIREMLERGHWSGELMQRRRDGTRVHILASGGVLRDGSGRPVGFAAVNRDISQRRRREQELAEAHLRLEQLDGLKTRFLAMASHDLRAPLAAIQGALDVIGELGDGLPAEGREMAGIIQRSTARMRRLVRDLLDLACIEQGTLPVTRRVIDLRQVVASAIAEVRPTAGPLRITVQAFLPPGPVLAWIDPDRISQVLANLLSNATRFARREVRLALECGDDGCEVIVEDDGPGIAPEVLPILFRPFHPAKRDAPKAETGLGLAIAHAIVVAHGGRLEAGDRAAEPFGATGARFVVSLPQPLLAAELDRG